MKNIKNNLFSKLLKNQKGVSAILVAIILPVLLGFTALAIDVGYMYATKNELQNIADAAALAGSGELGRIYLDMDSKDHAGHVLSSVEKDRIYQEAVNVTNLNDSEKLKDPDNKESFIDTTDISIGVWDWKLKKLDPPDPGNNNSADAVQVIVRRSEGNERVLATFFARIFSIFGGSHETFESSAVATAALSGMSVAEPGVLQAPFGISTKHPCDGGIVNFHPTGSESCVAWHNFSYDKINKDDLNSTFIHIIRGSGQEGIDWLDTHFSIENDAKLAGSFSSEETFIGDEFIFQGGTIEALFQSGDYYLSWEDKDTPGVISKPNSTEITNPLAFRTLFDFFRFRDEGDGSGSDLVDFCGAIPSPKADDVWTTTVPIYAETNEECKNLSGKIEIVGFAEIRIMMPEYDVIDVCYDCDEIVEPGRGGGGFYGNVKGSIPNLVQ